MDVVGWCYICDVVIQKTRRDKTKFMKNAAIILLCILTQSCTTSLNRKSTIKSNKTDLLFEMDFEHSLISRGNNFPDFKYSKDSMDYFLIALHENIMVEDFRKKVGFSSDRIKKIEKLLESKNWLHYIDGNPKPRVFIATNADGLKLFEKSLIIANKIVDGIEGELLSIKQKFKKTEISKTQKFEKWAFLILSNVLLDSWQIDNVERMYLKKEIRPERHGKNYYYSIMENKDRKHETFGIYGNQYEEIDGRTISTYGNNRIGLEVRTSENRIVLADNKIFDEMATDFMPKLTTILDSENDYIKMVYKESGYQEEITFEEFFIWWYHFIYTKATDIMNDNGMLSIPESGNFSYEIEES